MHRTALALVIASTFACTGRRPGGTLPNNDGGTNNTDGGGKDANVIVNPGDGGVITPPDGSVVNAIYDECPDFEHTLDAPINVNDEQNTIARDPIVTTFLVPFARDAAIFSLNSLVVYGANSERLPAQFETISRWGGRPDDCTVPIRYAYAHVRAAPAAGSREQWSVRSEVNPSPESSTMVVSEASTAWVIDTGPARFTVEKPNFRGLSKVEVRDAQGNLQTVSDLGSFVIEHDGTKTTDNLAAWYVSLEKKGAQVATVAARGYYASPGGGRDLAYTIRLHFFAGSGVVKIDHAYYFGEVANSNADGAYNTTVIGRAYMNVPLAQAPTAVRIRGDQTVHPLSGSVRIEQEKRAPDDDAVRFVVNDGAELERGTWAQRPFLSVATPSFSAMATIARMAVRDPQGLRYDAATNSLQLDFTSSQIQMGGARGIWGVGAIDFSAAPIDDARADALQLHAERPLVGAPLPSYSNGTLTIGPYAPDESGPAAALFTQLRTIHEATNTYFEDLRITGIQIWPDIHSTSCVINFSCDGERTVFFEGGHNNYWNWSKPGIDEFFRTGNNDYLYDFSLGEATTYAETLAIRTYHDRSEDSSVTGMAPCYGSSRGFSGDYREGLNNRRDNCPADYSYSKTLKVAYLASGDRRFADFFEEAAVGVTNIFGAPPDNPQPYLELNLTRLSEQRLENLANGAEFTRDPASNDFLRGKLTDYINYMLGRSMIDGHACDTASTGQNDARAIGYCDAVTGWIAPVPVEWALRSSRLLSHPALHAWVMRHGEQAARHMTVLDGQGLPDFSQAYGPEGWRIGYHCDANQDGVVDSSCVRSTGGENDSYYYQNGMVAFLNLFGLILSADPSDPQRICQWLPAVYGEQVGGIPDYEINGGIWGKSSGQAFGMAAEAAGALSYCR
jgi:hypothetical protein